VNVGQQSYAVFRVPPVGLRGDAGNFFGGELDRLYLSGHRACCTYMFSLSYSPQASRQVVTPLVIDDLLMVNPMLELMYPFALGAVEHQITVFTGVLDLCLPPCQ
jgi:hypothetical protein